MTIREIIEADSALYADMRESLRRQSVSIVYESDSVLITLENDWKLYTVAAADLEEAKREIEKLNEKDTFFVVHDTELKDFLCDRLGYTSGEGCIPYGQIYESNKASLELNASLGMELSEGRLYWVTNRKFITYKETKDFKADDIERLFLSVNWESGRYPEKLVRAMRNSTHVVSAWDRNRLVGLVRALDDGETVAFLHYLLVDPEYQGMKIGEELMKRILSHFENHLYVKIMPSDPKAIPFYERFGFQIYENYSAMVRKRFE